MKRIGIRAAVILAFFVLGSAEVRAAALQDPKTPAPEAKPVVSFGAEFWYIDVRGNVESNRSGITDTTFNLSSDAGIDDDIVPMLFIEYSPDPGHAFRLSFRRLEESGSHTLGRNVVFDGVDFPQGADVSSDLQATWYGLEWRIRVGAETVEGFHGESVVAFRWLEAVFEMSGAPGKGREKYSIESFGYGFDMKHVFEPGITVGSDFGVTYGFEDRFIGGEFTLKAGYQSNRVSAEVGYRWWGLFGAIDDRPDLELRMRGPFIGATFSF